jgi:hypothetical protein
MARSISREKLGFYVIDPKHHEAILSLVEPSANQNVRLLDPFAGEGDFLALAAERWKMTPYANELDEERAAICIARFGSQAVHGDALTLVASNEAFSALWINPPYDTVAGEGDDSRVEFSMLRHSLKWAQLNAVVFWVVYQHHLTEKAASLFAKQFRRVDVWGLSGKHLGEYSQIIVAGIYGKNPNPDEAYENILKQRENPQILTIQEKPIYKLPPISNHQQFRFTTHLMSAQQGLALSKTYGASHNPSLHALLNREVLETKATDPIVQPRPGHTALILGTGITNGTILHTETGKAAVRGKITVNEELARREVEGDPNDAEKQVVKTTYRLRPSSTISLLGEDGTITTLEGDEALLEFIGKNQESLADYLNRSFNPLYKFDFSLSTHSLKPYLDGIKVKGQHKLYTAQKHIVAAICRGFETRKGVLLNGQMGVGKTSVASTAIIALTGNISRRLQEQMKPNQITLMVAPPHLIEKWERELRTMYPDIYVEHCKRHEDVKGFLDTAHNATRQINQFTRSLFASSMNVQQLLELELLIAAATVTPKVMLIKRDMVKLGSSSEEAVVWRKHHKAQWAIDAEIPEGYKASDRIVSVDMPHCPHCHSIVYMSTGKGKNEKLESASKDWLNKTRRNCGVCQQPLWQAKRLQWEAPKEGEKYPPCNPRYRLDEYFAQKYPDRIYLLIWDEVHEAQRADRGNGSAFGRLANVSEKILAMTGTPFNGKSSSLFNLEYHINVRVREKYPWGGAVRLSKKKRGSNHYQYVRISDTDIERGYSEARWVRDMGIMEKQIDEYPQYDSESGAYTGVATYERPYVESNGISPRLVAEMLDHTIYLSLQDLGANLPEYTEYTLPVPMDSDIGSTYDEIRTKLKDYLKDRYWEGDTSFRGSYLQWSLGWPNRPYEATDIIHNIRSKVSRNVITPVSIAKIPAFDPHRIFNKEQELIDLLNSELEDNRPCVIYVRQTDTNDIQPRLEMLIKKHVSKAKLYTLRASVNPEKREKVINQQIEQGVNVLITNPILVATGLDLIQFKSLIWYEPIYDLRVMSQASSRTLRANASADIPLKTIYMFYEGTMEHSAIALMSRKQRAAKLLTGEVGLSGLDSLTEDESNFEESLVNTMLTGKQQLVDPRELFKKEEKTDALTQADLVYWNKPEESSEETIITSPWDIVREYYNLRGKNQGSLSSFFENNLLRASSASIKKENQSQSTIGISDKGTSAKNAKQDELETLPMFMPKPSASNISNREEAKTATPTEAVANSVTSPNISNSRKQGKAQEQDKEPNSQSIKSTSSPVNTKPPTSREISSLKRLGTVLQTEAVFSKTEKARIAQIQALSEEAAPKPQKTTIIYEDSRIEQADMLKWLESNEKVLVLLPQSKIFNLLPSTSTNPSTNGCYLEWQEAQEACMDLVTKAKIFSGADRSNKRDTDPQILLWQNRMEASLYLVEKQAICKLETHGLSADTNKQFSRIADHIHTALENANPFGINLSYHSSQLTTLILNGVPDPQDSSLRIASGINEPYFDTSKTASKKLKTAVKNYLREKRLIIDKELAETLSTKLVEAAIKARDIFQAKSNITPLRLETIPKEKQLAFG